MNTIHRSKYTTLVLPKHCSSQISSEEHSEIANLVNASSNLLINGIETTEIDESWIEIFLLFKYRLDSLQKKLRLVNFTKQLEEKLVSGLFKHKELFSSSVQEALTDFKSDSIQEPNHNFLKAFIQTTPRVLYIKVQMLCKQKKISMKKGGLGLLPGEISGIVKVSTPELHYAIILCFPTSTFLKIMSKMLGETFTEINKDIQEGAAELLNIINGQVRSQIKSHKPDDKASIATVFMGNKLPALEFEGKGTIPLENGKMVTIPFESFFGDFFIEAWFPNDFTGLLT